MNERGIDGGGRSINQHKYRRPVDGGGCGKPGVYQLVLFAGCVQFRSQDHSGYNINGNCNVAVQAQ